MVWFLGECLRSAAFDVEPPNDPTDDPKKYEKLNIPGDCLRSVAFAIQPRHDPTDDPEKYGKTFEKSCRHSPLQLGKR